MSKAEKILKGLEAYCLEHGERVTEPRTSVLSIVTLAKKPLTAYEILDELGKTIKNPKPPTAYRALEFLTQHGFIHRIESLNAYIACAENHKHSGSQFLICDSCGDAQEIHLCHIPDNLQTQAAKHHFTARHWNVELHGLCQKCRV